MPISPCLKYPQSSIPINNTLKINGFISDLMEFHQNKKLGRLELT